ncbi:MAG: DsbA family protein [Patescibacteria group bacterium]
MRLKLNAKHLAVMIIILSIVIFAGTAFYKWYITSNTTFVAGMPPEELLTRIEPKTVPYEQIKPPAVTQNDKFILGSASSSIGIIFFGDYADRQSADLINKLKESLKDNKKIRLIWRDLPETTDENDPGFEAAVISNCSKLIHEDWYLHDKILKIQNEKLTNNTLKQIVFEDMDAEMLYTCWNDTAIRNQVRLNVQTYRGDGIDTAPFIFVGTQAIPAAKADMETILEALKTYNF